MGSRERQISREILWDIKNLILINFIGKLNITTVRVPLDDTDKSLMAGGGVSI